MGQAQINRAQNSTRRVGQQAKSIFMMFIFVPAFLPHYSPCHPPRENRHVNINVSIQHSVMKLMIDIVVLNY